MKIDPPSPATGPFRRGTLAPTLVALPDLVLDLCGNGLPDSVLDARGNGPPDLVLNLCRKGVPMLNLPGHRCA